MVGSLVGGAVMRFTLRKLNQSTREWKDAAIEHGELAKEYKNAAEEFARRAENAEARVQEWT
jgi:hypothetical protein